MKGLTLIVAIMVVLAPAAFAKRLAPAKVKPVAYEGIQYRAPISTFSRTGKGFPEKMGVVEAWKEGKMLWQKKVYTVKLIPGLERDVQDVFIKELEIVDGKLIVTNERNDRYSVDLRTQEVTKLEDKEETPTASGAATPKELLQRAVEAHKNKKPALLASCFTPKGAVASEVEWLMTESAAPLVAQGKAKYGEAAFSKALGSCAFVLGQMAKEPPYRILLEKGSVSIDGDTAEYAYEIQKSARHKSKQSVNLTKVNGRWYFDTPFLKDIEKATLLKEALTDYISHLEKAIGSSDEASTFASAMTDANGKLLSTMKKK